MTARSKALARARGQRATPLTREEHHRFRTGVIAALRTQTNRTIHATVLEFARQLIEQYHAERPFEDRTRIGARLRKLEQQGVIRYEKSRSHNYWVVRAITLVEETALDAPRRQLHAMGRASEDEQRRRRMELLATLDHLGGEAESLRALVAAAVKEYGRHHRPGTGVYDSATLTDGGLIEKRPGRAHGRMVMRVILTRRGRQALTRYHHSHSGEPRPPAPTDIGAAAPAAAAPKSPRVGLSELSRALLGEVALYSGAGRELAEIITTLALVWNHPSKKGFAQTIRFRCRDLASSGYLERTLRGTYRITEDGIRAISAASAPTPQPAASTAPAAAASAPPAPATTTAPAAPTNGPAHAEPSGPLPEAVRAIEADITQTSLQLSAAEERRAALEQQILDLERTKALLAQRCERLERLRTTTLEAYAADTPPTTPSDATKP